MTSYRQVRSVDADVSLELETLLACWCSRKTHGYYTGQLSLLQPRAVQGGFVTNSRLMLPAGHLETVQLLLKRRADPRATNRKGEAPLAMARDDAVREVITAALAAPPPSSKPASAQARQASLLSVGSSCPRSADGILCCAE